MQESQRSPCSGYVTKGWYGSRSKPCNVKRRSCEVCESVNNIYQFKRREKQDIQYTKGPFDCNSNHLISSSECKQCQYYFLFVGSTKTKLRYRINNYIATHRKFRKKYVEKDLVIVMNNSELKQKIISRTLLFRRPQKNWKLKCHSHRLGWRSHRLDKWVKNFGPKWS